MSKMAENKDDSVSTNNRHMVSLSEDHKAKLKKIAKDFHLTQGEVIEVILDNLDEERMNPIFKGKRESKTGGKEIRIELLKKIKLLSPERLAAVEALIG